MIDISKFSAVKIENGNAFYTYKCLLKYIKVAHLERDFISQLSLYKLNDKDTLVLIPVELKFNLLHLMELVNFLEFPNGKNAENVKVYAWTFILEDEKMLEDYLYRRIIMLFNSELESNFDVIGISETRISFCKDILKKEPVVYLEDSNFDFFEPLFDVFNFNALSAAEILDIIHRIESHTNPIDENLLRMEKIGNYSLLFYSGLILLLLFAVFVAPNPSTLTFIETQGIHISLGLFGFFLMFHSLLSNSRIYLLWMGVIILQSSLFYFLSQHYLSPQLLRAAKEFTIPFIPLLIFPVFKLLCSKRNGGKQCNDLNESSNKLFFYLYIIVSSWTLAIFYVNGFFE